MISSAGGPPYGSQVNARRISWSASRGMRECFSVRSLSRRRCLRGSRYAAGCSSSAAVVSARWLLLDLGSGRKLRVLVGGSGMGNQLSRECVHSKCAGSAGAGRYSRAAVSLWPVGAAAAAPVQMSASAARLHGRLIPCREGDGSFTRGMLCWGRCCSRFRRACRLRSDAGSPRSDCCAKHLNPCAPQCRTGFLWVR